MGILKGEPEKPHHAEVNSRGALLGISSCRSGLRRADERAAPCNSNPAQSVNHAVKCGAGTANAWRIAANASEPLDGLAKPCSMKRKPTIRRNGIAAHRAIGNRPSKSNAVSRNDFLGSAIGLKIVFMSGSYAKVRFKIALLLRRVWKGAKLFWSCPCRGFAVDAPGSVTVLKSP
jgi:hypothetical protein